MTTSFKNYEIVFMDFVDRWCGVDFRMSHSIFLSHLWRKIQNSF